MIDRLSADDLRARIGGAKPPESFQASPTPVTDQRGEPTSVGHATATAAKPSFRKGPQAAETATAEAPKPRTDGVRPNRYGGKCQTCAVWVEAGAGVLVKTDEGWGVEHQAGACAPGLLDPREGDYYDVDLDVPPSTTAKPSQAVIKAVTGQVYTGIHPGLYTVETEEGHRTFRVRVQGTEEDFAPGQTILEYLIGPDNGNDYVGIAFLRGTRAGFWKRYQGEEHTVIREDAALFLADPDAALKAKNCIRCGATLTTPASLAAGMGEVCRNKGW